MAASTRRYKHLNLSLSFSGGVGGGVCIVLIHTLAVADDVLDGFVDNACFTNIGLVLDMSNGTSEEEEEYEEEDLGDIVLAVGVQATVGTGCRRWNGGCVTPVTDDACVVADS
jgi:hypothetical protein